MATRSASVGDLPDAAEARRPGASGWCRDGRDFDAVRCGSCGQGGSGDCDGGVLAPDSWSEAQISLGRCHTSGWSGGLSDCGGRSPVSSDEARHRAVETVSSADEWFESFRGAGQLRLRVALSSSFGAEVGEESAADAVAYAWEHRERLAEMANPGGFLFRVGQSAARRHRRRAEVGALPEVSAAHEDRIDPDLPIALGKLTERQRVAVVLVHVCAWTLEETATAMELRVSTVRTHVARALGRLEQLLEEDGR